MIRLSKPVQGQIRLYRLFAGIFLLGMVLCLILIPDVSGWWFVFLGACILVTLLSYFVFERYVVDEVYDAGDSLVFRKGDIEQTVMLVDIDDMEVQNNLFDTVVTVYCRHSGEIGSRLIFAAGRGDAFFSSPPEIARLLARFEEAKTVG